MKLLFVFFVLSYLLALFDLALFPIITINSIDFKNIKPKDIVFKMLMPFISLIFLILIFIYAFKVSSLVIFIIFVFINILLFGGIYTVIYEYDEYYDFSAGGCSAIIVSLLFLFVGLIFLPIEKDVSKKEITVPLYATSDSTDRKTLLLNITDEEKGNIHFSLEYNEEDTKGIELPFDFDDISECKINKSSENKIVIIKSTIIESNFYSYFGFKKIKSYEYDYYLYINEEHIQNLGN